MSKDETTADQHAQVVRDVADQVRQHVSQHVFGHEKSIQLLTGALLIGGNVLIEGAPGIGKTLLARTFAAAVTLQFSRIQFTPDLMPSDVTGVNIFDPRSTQFRFSPGAIFCDILLADEINRASPKTQSALLEAMEERQVTIDGARHQLSKFFTVLATQNPIEHEGTFPLPEAQLDRFLFKVSMSYPAAQLEREMILERSAAPLEPAEARHELDEGIEPVPEHTTIDAATLARARAALRALPLSPTLADYIQRLTAASREHPEVVLGASPRAGLHLALASKYCAASKGRAFPIPDDVQEMAPVVLQHRILREPDVFDDGNGTASILESIIQDVPVPREILS